MWAYLFNMKHPGDDETRKLMRCALVGHEIGAEVPWRRGETHTIAVDAKHVQPLLDLCSVEEVRSGGTTLLRLDLPGGPCWISVDKDNIHIGEERCPT